MEFRKYEIGFVDNKINFAKTETVLHSDSACFCKQKSRNAGKTHVDIFEFLS